MKKTTQIILAGMLLITNLSSCASSGHKNSKTVYSKKANKSLAKEDRFRLTIITLAREMKGKKYKRGGKGPNAFDCSGLVFHVFKEMNVQMAASAGDQAKAGKPIDIDDSKPGDLIFFSSKSGINHVGIITESTKNKLMVVHSTSSMGVIEENILQSDFWLRKIKTVTSLNSYSQNIMKQYSGL